MKKESDPKNSIAMTHIFEQTSPRPNDLEDPEGKKYMKNIIKEGQDILGALG